MICWFADFLIHEDLMVNFWVPFLSRDFWICLQFENEGNDDIWRSSWVETTNLCSDAAKLWLLFPQLFRFRNHSFLRKRSTDRTHQQNTPLEMIFLTPSHRGYRVKIQPAGVPHQVSFCCKIRFVNVTFQACSHQNFDTGFLKQMFSWHIDSLQRLSFVSSKEAGANLLDFSHLLQRNHSFFSSAAFPYPIRGSRILRFYIPPCAKGAFCVTFFFSGEKVPRHPWLVIQ